VGLSVCCPCCSRSCRLRPRRRPPARTCGRPCTRAGCDPPSRRAPTCRSAAGSGSGPAPLRCRPRPLPCSRNGGPPTRRFGQERQGTFICLGISTLFCLLLMTSSINKDFLQGTHYCFAIFPTVKDATLSQLKTQTELIKIRTMYPVKPNHFTTTQLPSSSAGSIDSSFTTKTSKNSFVKVNYVE